MNIAMDRSEQVLELFDNYYERVFAFARKSAGPTVAEDVAQEVFVRLMQHPRLDELSISISYLLKIAHNLLRRRHTRGTRLREILDDEVRPREQDRMSGTHGRKAMDGRSDVITDAMGQLSSEEQDAIRMIVCEGRSYAHAANSLGVSVTTINNWKHRGLKKLRGHVERDESIMDDSVSGRFGRMGYEPIEFSAAGLKRA